MKAATVSQAATVLVLDIHARKLPVLFFASIFLVPIKSKISDARMSSAAAYYFSLIVRVCADR